MKYFNIDDSVDEAMLQKFVDFWNSNQDEEMTIIINSPGGKNALTTVMLHLINSNVSKVTLMACGIYSATFRLFYEANCKKLIVQRTIGMYHMPYVSKMSLGLNNEFTYYEDVCLHKNFKCNTEKVFVEQFMKKKELKKFWKNKDVFFTFKRMQQIFPDAQII